MIVADPSLYPDGVVVQVPAATYQLQFRIFNESGFAMVSQLRAFCRSGGARGASLGEVSVDFARMGVGDNLELAKVTQAITPEMAEPIWASLETENRWGIVPWSPNVTMPFVVPGDGDGSYEVFELVDEHGRLGVQIDFLPTN